MPTIRQVTAAALALALGGGAAAHADLKIVQSTSVNNPQLTAMIKSMSPQQRAVMGHSSYGAMLSGGAITSVIYSHGSLTRMDMGLQSTIMDTSTHKLISINRTAHTYSTSTYAPQQMASQIQANVKDTGQMKTILGHPARHYTVSMSSPQMQGARIAGDVWSAQDLPQPPAAAFSGGPAGALQGEFRKIKGMPLLMNMMITGSPIGTMSVHSVTKSVSRSPLSSSLFTVPSGYRRIAAASRPGMPPMGR